MKVVEKIKNTENDEQLIGGQTDENGCLVAAGYSWCELKNKCLRVWEEPCVSEDEQAMIENYLKENISTLSPTKEVLGGKFYITRFLFSEPGIVMVDYEDGHIALEAEVRYSIDEDKVDIIDFSITNDNGYNPEASEILPSEEDSAAIKKIFLDKYNKGDDEVQVVIEQFDDNYARGSVKIAMNKVFGAGGIFLVYKKDGNWVLAFDGNGSISCTEMEGYGFPTDMIFDCYREETIDTSGATGMANPASTYCVEHGGTIEIRNRKNGQYGVCLFEDNRQCEEWALYRSQCPTGGVKITGYDNEAEIYCAITGGQVEGGGTETPMCKRVDGTYCNAQANFDGDCPDPNDPNPNAGNREAE